MPGLPAPNLQTSDNQQPEAPVAVDTSLVTPAPRMQGAAPPLAPTSAASPDLLVADADVAQIEPQAAIQDVVKPGPPPTHRVVAGESLWTIARLHHVDMDQLRQWNELDRRAVVHPGQTLKLVP